MPNDPIFAHFRALIPPTSEQPEPKLSDAHASAEAAAQAVWPLYAPREAPGVTPIIPIHNALLGALTVAYVTRKDGEFVSVPLHPWSGPVPCVVYADGIWPLRTEKYLLSAPDEDLEQLILDRTIPERMRPFLLAAAQAAGVPTNDETTEFQIVHDSDIDAFRTFVRQAQFLPDDFENIDYTDAAKLRRLRLADAALDLATQHGPDSRDIEALHTHFKQHEITGDFAMERVIFATDLSDFGTILAREEPDLPDWAEAHFNYESYGKARAEDYHCYTLQDGTLAFVPRA